MAQYFISKNNQNVGPMTPEQLVQQGLTPNSMVWAEGMPEWVPASQVPELAPYLGAPARPAMPAQPAMNMSTTTIFQFVLYGVLAFAAIVGLIMFINSFTLFSSAFKIVEMKPAGAGIFLLLSSLMMIAISVVIAIRVLKKKNFAFLSLMFFGITFLFGLLNLIILGGWAMFILMLVVGILGIACTLFAAIPMNKLGDPNSFKAIFAKPSGLDIALIGAYAIFLLLLIILGAGKEHASEIFKDFSGAKEFVSSMKDLKSLM